MDIITIARLCCALVLALVRTLNFPAFGLTVFSLYHHDSRSLVTLERKYAMLKNDLREEGSAFGFDDFEKIPYLSSFKVERYKAERWAQRDCKFLIYDDTSPAREGFDSDDDIATTDIDTSSQVNDFDDAELKTQSKGKGKASAAADPTDMDKVTCLTCSRCPEFPNRRKSTKFRLFRPHDEPEELDHITGKSRWSKKGCAHYVAVSYCWPIPKYNKEGEIIQERRSYQVRDLDGTIRPNRALDDVIDRAVEVANLFHLRLIWIDQECLPQPTQESSQEDWDYQKIGIQAMDILYNRAVVTAGLHNIELTTQAQVDCLGGRNDSLPTIVDLLEAITQDRWYTRAWVIQEAVSAGSGLVLTFGRRLGLSSPSDLGLSMSSAVPSHSLDKRPQKYEASVVCLPVDDFRALVRSARAALQQLDLNDLVENVWPRIESLDRIRNIVEAAENLHPALSPTKYLPMNMAIDGLHLGRDAVEAVGALSLLKKRDCGYLQDLIPIVANMCSYEERLDTDAVVKNCTSLRLILLTLALINGDYSLFVPEAYMLPFPHGFTAAIPGWVFPPMCAWADPFFTTPHLINHVRVHRLSDVRMQATSAANNIVEFPAYVWVVEEKLDMTAIKARYFDDWILMKCIRVALVPNQGENTQQYDARRRAMDRYFRSGDTTTQIKREIQEHGSLAKDSALWGGYSSEEVLIVDYLPAHTVQRVPFVRERVTKILIDILRHLSGQSHMNPRAASAATSIWHSIRTDDVNDRGSIASLPDVVDDKFFLHPSVLNEDPEIFQLDMAPDGQYAQLWLVDRIMTHGYLWAGRYVRSHSPVSLIPEVNSSEISKQPVTVTGKDESSDERPNRKSTLNMQPGFKHALAYLSDHDKFDNITTTIYRIGRFTRDETEKRPQRAAKTRIPTPGREEKLLTETDVGSDKSRLQNRSIIDRQMSRMFIASELKTYMQDYAADADNERSDQQTDGVVTVGSMVALITLFSNNPMMFSKEQSRVRDLVSVFDVDGPCIVATVYNAAWEVLPRPDLRSMSVAWVVEPLELPHDPAEKEFNNPDVQYKHDGCHIKEPLSESDVSLMEALQEKRSLAYRVRNKTRGMWRIMDIPSQGYLFF